MNENSYNGFAPVPGQANGYGNDPSMPAPAPNAGWGAPAQDPGAYAGQAPYNQQPVMQAPMQPVMPNPSNYGPATNVAAKPEKAPREKKGSGEIIVLVVIGLIAAIGIVFAVFFAIQFNDLKRNFESQKNYAVSEAIYEQIEKDKEEYRALLAQDTTQWVGPEDYGRISFYYRKDWSVYVSKDGRNNDDYEAYFSPVNVDPVSNTNSRYALRFIIRQRRYEDVMGDYEQLLDQGLACQSVTFDSGQLKGSRCEGALGDGIRGIVVLLKVNDKTVILQTDSLDNYKDSFDEIVSKLRKNA